MIKVTCLKITWKDPFGGELILSYRTSSKALADAILEMERQISFGLIYGRIIA
jgi:hypothetical protein